jgi:transcription elongation factor Elf1
VPLWQTHNQLQRSVQAALIDCSRCGPVYSVPANDRTTVSHVYGKWYLVKCRWDAEKGHPPFRVCSNCSQEYNCHYDDDDTEGDSQDLRRIERLVGERWS